MTRQLSLMEARVLSAPTAETLTQPKADSVTVSLAGVPQGKGRARSFIYKSKRTGLPAVGHYPDKSTESYEGMIKYAAMQAMKGRDLLRGAVRLELFAIFMPPESWSKKRKEAALNGEIHHTSRPDLDNIVKVWKDALNGAVWADDCLVVELGAGKLYGDSPAVHVTVVPL